MDEIGDDKYSLLSAAADRGDVGIVRALALSGKVDVNKADTGGGVPLVLAARGGHTPCLAAASAASRSCRPSSASGARWPTGAMASRRATMTGQRGRPRR